MLDWTDEVKRDEEDVMFLYELARPISAISGLSPLPTQQKILCSNSMIRRKTGIPLDPNPNVRSCSFMWI
jgi:hypothetical protein